MNTLIFNNKIQSPCFSVIPMVVEQVCWLSIHNAAIMVSARAFFLFIHPSISYTHVLLPSRSQGSARACPGCHGQLVLDKSPVHCRATSNDKQRSTPVHTNTDNLKFLSRLTCTFEYTQKSFLNLHFHFLLLLSPQVICTGFNQPFGCSHLIWSKCHKSVFKSSLAL